MTLTLNLPSTQAIPRVGATEAARLCGVSLGQFRYLVRQGRVSGIDRTGPGARKYELPAILSLAAAIEAERARNR